MSCCGKRHVGPHAQAVSVQSSSLPSPAGSPSDPTFEYVGANALTVTGPVTGRLYRFDTKGARLSINRHDAPSLLYVPNLRPVVRR